MSFIGNVPAESYTTVVKDTFSGNDSTTDFTLSIPATTNSVEVFVENVQQEPTDAYTISGTTLSFTAAPVTGTDNIYVIHRGPAVQQVVPPAGVALSPSTVTATGDISTEGDLKVEVASGGIYTITGTDTASNRTLTLPDEAGTVLTSGTDVSNFPSGFANGVTSHTLFRLTSNVSSDTNPLTAWEKPTGQQFGDEVTVSSGTFTFPSTGFYSVHFDGLFFIEPDDNVALLIYVSTDGGSNYSSVARAFASGDGSTNSDSSTSTFAVVDVTSTTDVKVRLATGSIGSGSELDGNTSENRTFVSFTRLGDT